MQEEYTLTKSLGFDLSNDAVSPLVRLEPLTGNHYCIGYQEMLRILTHPLCQYTVNEACKWADYNQIPNMRSKVYAVMHGESKQGCIMFMGVKFNVVRG
jgi:hypothetical protein